MEDPCVDRGTLQGGATATMEALDDLEKALASLADKLGPVRLPLDAKALKDPEEHPGPVEAASPLRVRMANQLATVERLTAQVFLLKDTVDL